MSYQSNSDYKKASLILKPTTLLHSGGANITPTIFRKLELDFVSKKILHKI